MSSIHSVQVKNLRVGDVIRPQAKMRPLRIVEVIPYRGDGTILRVVSLIEGLEGVVHSLPVLNDVRMSVIVDHD